MSFTRDGMMNLPVEIWEHIFTMATIASNSNFDTTVISLLAPPKTMWEQPKLLTTYQDSVKLAPYGDRRSFTLVCKSWYFIANRILWSNLFIDLRRPSAVIENLGLILARNTLLAELVVCVILRDNGRRFTWPDKEIERRDTQRSNHILNKIIPHLTHVKIICSPRSLVEKATWTIRPDLVMIYDRYSRADTDDDCMLGRHFWDGCQTLIINHSLPNYHANSFESYGAPPIFSNLINLRIKARHSSPIQYMEANWELPRLQSLSISGLSILSWTAFLERVKSTLQILEIDVNRGIAGLTVPPAVVMSRLSTLCLCITATIAEGRTPIAWIDYITAPRLDRFVLYHVIPNRHDPSERILGPFLRESDVPMFVAHIVESAITRYQTLQVLTFAIGNRSKLVPRGAKEILKSIIEWKKVENWHSLGLEVEVINQNEQVTYRLRENDFKRGISTDKMDLRGED